jgi:HNH endonuclease
MSNALRFLRCDDPACDCSGCLLWTGRQDKNGYGQVWTVGRTQRVHRVMWELDNGPIPAGLTIDHVHARGCRHRNCANPAHLEAVTMRVNTLRGGGVSAVCAAKTHCLRGHPFSEANTYLHPRGRECRTCRRAAEARRNRKPQ